MKRRATKVVAVAGAALAWLGLSAGPAAAATVMVSSVDASAGPVGTTVVDALRASLERAGHRVNASATGLDEAAAMLGCPRAAAGCIARIAEAAGAEYIVVPEIAPAAGPAGAKEVTVRLTVHRGADGSTSGTKEVKVGEGAAPDYAAALAPLFTAPPAPPPPPPPTPPGAGSGATAPLAADEPRRTEVPGRILPVTWGVGGGAAVLLVLGGIFEARTMVLQGDFDAAPFGTAGDLRDAARLARRGKTSAALGATFLGVGVAAAAAFAFLVVDNLELGLVFRLHTDWTGVALAGSW